MSPEKPFEDDTQEELGEEKAEYDEARYHDFTPLRESFLVLNEKIQREFTNQNNVRKVLTAINQDREILEHFKAASRTESSFAVNGKSEITDETLPTSARIISVMILQMLTSKNSADKIKLWDLYKKLGFE